MFYPHAKFQGIRLGHFRDRFRVPLILLLGFCDGLLAPTGPLPRGAGVSWGGPMYLGAVSAPMEWLPVD